SNRSKREECGLLASRERQFGGRALLRTWGGVRPRKLCHRKNFDFFRLALVFWFQMAIVQVLTGLITPDRTAFTGPCPACGGLFFFARVFRRGSFRGHESRLRSPLYGPARVCNFSTTGW